MVMGQQIFFLHQIQKMVDKIMSRNYGDYRIAEEHAAQETPNRGIPQEPREDLRALDEIMI